MDGSSFQNELFDIIVRGEFEFISPYWDNINDGAMDLIRKLLIINPKKRYTVRVNYVFLPHSYHLLEMKI